MQPTVSDLLRHLAPSDLAVFAAGDFIDVRFRLHCQDLRALVIAAQFLSTEAPPREAGIHAIK